MEHLVSEQMLITDTKQAHCVIALKALAIANDKGQKIWKLLKLT
ncbi:hypothetical protein [Pseudoalteromonas sp. Ps84H-4]|nr:hypothetical protein [Pseudoalteromonas sp. Ps84H-4]